MSKNDFEVCPTGTKGQLGLLQQLKEDNDRLIAENKRLSEIAKRHEGDRRKMDIPVTVERRNRQ